MAINRHNRRERLQQAQAIFARGPLLEIGQYRSQATTLMADGRVTTALDLIALCSELSEQYRRSSRLSLSEVDRARLQATAAGVVLEVLL